MNENIIVEYPHGAGGSFLSSVLACCTTDLPWEPNIINFHKPLHQVESNHLWEPANNIISIDSSDARYNFWIYYFKKRVAHELKYYRYKNSRWIKCPYEITDTPGDGYWLLNQCRFIIQYNSKQFWKVNWGEMVTNPAASWTTIHDFLNSNNQPNYWSLDNWVSAVEFYKKTLSKKVIINTNHVRWQIWAVALLQEQGITPDFNLIENFRNDIFLNYLNKHNQALIETTKNYVWHPG
jgi:hypothetical protein